MKIISVIKDIESDDLDPDKKFECWVGVEKNSILFNIFVKGKYLYSENGFRSGEIDYDEFKVFLIGEEIDKDTLTEEEKVQIDEIDK